MDWIEQLFGIDLDAHTGTFEAMLVSLIGIGIVAAGAFWARRRSKRA